MSEQNQQSDQTLEKQYSTSVSAKFAGGTLLASLPLDLLAHLGPTGLLVGGLASYVAFRHGPEIYEGVRDLAPFLPPLETSEEGKKHGRSFLDRAKGRFPGRTDDQTQENAPEQEEASDLDTVFVSPQPANDVIGVQRITIEQMVRHTAYNSYEVYIGRSLTRPGNKAVKINFRKRHIKLIGASQHGKSSMAAALLEAILQTHDNEHVLLALLDLENKTSRLFVNAPHIAELLVGDKIVDLHARSYEEVLERLELICELIDYRYTLSEQELDTQPILLVYLEEFIDLKDYFKQKMSAAAGKDEREKAERQYTRLVYCIKKIAARGLKVLVQYLMCAQVDYRDDDLQEALINVTSGMSFSVRPSAAKAAGFYQNELIARNAKEDQVGQCVVEMPDCKDLILAPEYNLKNKLRALDAKERVYKKALPVNVETPVSRAVNTPVNASASQLEPLPENPRLRLLENENAPENELKDTEAATGNVNAETRETIGRMAAMNIPHRQIAKAFKLDGRNYPIYKQVCKELGIAMEKEA